MNTFAAIDFETANAKATSICSIGIVIVRDGNVAETIHRLVKPYPNEYGIHQTNVHGLTDQDTKDAPTFDVVWADIAPKIAGMQLIAHNKAFDESRLKATLEHYDINFDFAPFLCTLIAGRKACPELENHKLPTLTSHFGGNLENHHDALEDAQACAFLALKLFSSSEPPVAIEPSDKAPILVDIADQSSLKIGQLVNQELRKLLESGVVDASEIQRLQDKDYSKRAFDIQYPLLVSVNESYEHVRYYAKSVKIGGCEYKICSQWFEVANNNDRPALESWMRRYQPSGDTTSLTLEEAEIELSDALNDSGLKSNMIAVGMAAFVDLFPFVQANKTIEEAKKQLVDKAWSPTTWSSKYSTTKAIFRNQQELCALDQIINSSRVGEDVVKKALELKNAYSTSESLIIGEKVIPKENSLDAICQYAYSLGIQKSDIIDLIVAKINDSLEGKKVHLSITNKNVTLQEMSDDDAAYIEDSIIEPEKQVLNLAYYQYDETYDVDFNRVHQDFKRIFKSRLTTQNRKFSNGLTYLPTIFNKLDIDFNSILNRQLEKIYTYRKVNGGYERIKVLQLDELKFRENRMIGVEGNSASELYFKYENSYYTFSQFIIDFKDVSLGHTKSMYNIIDGLKDELTELMYLSNLAQDITLVDLKLKQQSDFFVAMMKGMVNLERLKYELLLIEEEIEMELIPTRLNIAIGKN